MNPANNPLRRVLLAAGTENYKHAATFPGGLEKLGAVPEELRAVVESLDELGYEPESSPDGPYLLDPDVQVLEDAIRTAAQKAQVAVIYYTGHGLKPDRHPYYVLTADSMASDLKRTALQPRDLLIHLLTENQEDAAGQPLVLVILDCCYSGAGGVEMLRDSLQEVGNPNVWVLASASSLQEAQEGLFARAFAAALRSPKIGHLTDFIPFDLFLRELNAALALERPGQQARLIRGEISGIPEFFPNREYVPEVAGLTIEEQRIWVSRLRAIPEVSAAKGFYLTGKAGRVHALEDIAAWMRAPSDHGLAVVTGSPGTGKSTLLALPVLLGAPDKAARVLAGATADSLTARAAGLFAGLPVFGIYAHGLDPYQITRVIARHLGLSDNIRDPEDLQADLVDGAAATRAAMGIVIIDAVDEAVNPLRLMDDLVLPLARHPGLKILIGTRRHLLHPYESALPLAASLLVDLDTGDYQDPQGLAVYAFQLLAAVHEPTAHSPYREAPDEVTSAVAAAIACRATATTSDGGQTESFLVAQLLALAVRSRDQVLDPAVPGWAAQLPGGVGAAFDEEMSRLGSREAGARVLLTALGWAQGTGLPWENIWVPVSRALADAGAMKAPSLGNGDVRWLLQTLGRYVVEDLGPGRRSVFRPFHELLAAHLRGEPDRETLLADPVAAQTWQERSRQVEAVITGALLDTVPAGRGGRREWEFAHPYLLTYLARHAHAAGPETFVSLVADPDYLAVADPALLTPLLTPTDLSLRTIARAYRRARPLLDSDPSENAAYLQEAFVAETGHSLGRPYIRPTYRTLMARTRREDSLLALTGHGGWVSSVAFGIRPDGGHLLASGGADGMLRLWDPDTGTQTTKPLGHGSPVRAIAFGPLADGRLVLASAGSGKVRLWDPETGTESRSPFVQGCQVTSVAFGTRADGRLLLASAGEDGKVRLWDPETGTEAGKPLTGHRGRVLCVAFGTQADGRLLLASAGENGKVRLWDPDTGSQTREPLEHHATVRSVAFGTGADRQLMLASAGEDGKVRLWHPGGGTEAINPLGHGGTVRSVAFGTGAHGQLLLVSAGYDGALRLWDAETGTQVGEPFGRGGPVASVAFGTRSDGRLLLASADGLDGTVRLWDPETGNKAGQPLGEGSEVASVASVAFGIRADGRLLLASGGPDGKVGLWDANTGTEMCAPLTGHEEDVPSVAFGKSADGRLLLASAGGRDGKVRLWDAYTGARIGRPLNHGGGLDSVAFGTRSDGRLLLASAGSGKVRLWDPETGTQATKLLDHGGPVRAVAFGARSDGRLLLASAGSGKVRLWDPETGTETGTPLTGPHGRVLCVAFGTQADGQLILASAGEGGKVRLWDPETGTQTWEPLEHQAEVRSVAFGTSPDGKLMLASAGEDGRVRLWHPEVGTTFVSLRRRTPTASIALHGTVLAIGDQEGVAVVEVFCPAKEQRKL